jgi:tRNA (guanine-N7-)-methyltransferase
MTQPANDKRRIYGRRLGRPLKQERLGVLETLLPKLALPEGVPLDPAQLFGASPQSLWMEIGFGNGEHVKALLERHPDRHFLAAEPFINGMAAFLKSIREEPALQDRVRVRMDDAMPVVHALPADCLDGIYVLNPDPWPKKRHFKRRIISQENLDAFARVLKPGAPLVMTTDVEDLAEWMLDEARRHPAFEWQAESAADWKRQPPGWVETRYEQKGARAGRQQSYIIFIKKIAA